AAHRRHARARRPRRNLQEQVEFLHQEPERHDGNRGAHPGEKRALVGGVVAVSIDHGALSGYLHQCRRARVGLIVYRWLMPPAPNGAIYGIKWKTLQARVSGSRNSQVPVFRTLSPTNGIAPA